MMGVNSLRLFLTAGLFGSVVFSLTGKPDEASLLKGKAIFEKQCAECHGKDGRGVEGEYDKPLLGD